jgi:hypothetical protein
MALSLFTAGAKLRASILNALVNQINSLTAPGWVSYGTSTTVLTASTTNPTMGNSTFTADYRRAADNSDLVIARMTITIGSSFSAGSGNYRFLLPTNASTKSQNASVGTFWINDFGTAFRVGSALIGGATYVELHPHNGTGGPYGSGGPGTAWASGDVIKWQIEYEPA